MIQTGPAAIRIGCKEPHGNEPAIGRVRCHRTLLLLPLIIIKRNSIYGWLLNYLWLLLIDKVLEKAIFRKAVCV